MPFQKAKTSGTSREDIDRRLFMIGRDVLEMEQLENAMNARIDAIKAEYSGQLETLHERIKSKAQALRLAVEDSRQDLFTGRRKTIHVLMGSISFRKQPDTIRIRKGFVEADVFRALKTKGFPQFVRTRPELNKAAIGVALRDEQIQQDTLKPWGVELRPGGEDFRWEVNRASVREEMKDDAQSG